MRASIAEGQNVYARETPWAPPSCLRMRQDIVELLENGAVSARPRASSATNRRHSSCFRQLRVTAHSSRHRKSVLQQLDMPGWPLCGGRPSGAPARGHAPARGWLGELTTSSTAPMMLENEFAVVSEVYTGNPSCEPVTALCAVTGQRPSVCATGMGATSIHNILCCSVLRKSRQPIVAA